MKFIVAIDGTAASGKGTLGKKIAKHFDFNYLDTGILYRIVAYNFQLTFLAFKEMLFFFVNFSASSLISIASTSLAIPSNIEVIAKQPDPAPISSTLH